jgi:hypothetical protein
MNGAIMKLLFQNISQKLLIGLLVVFGSVLSAKAQDSKLQLSSLDTLAAKASQTVDVNIDERLVRMTAKVLGNEDDEAEIKKLIAGVKGIYVKSFEFEKEGEYSPADVEGIRSQLRGPLWSRLVNVTSKKEGLIEVYVLLNGDSVGGLAILSAEAKELTVVNIVGPVDLNKLAKFEGQFGIPDLGLDPQQKPKIKKEN